MNVVRNLVILVSAGAAVSAAALFAIITITPPSGGGVSPPPTTSKGGNGNNGPTTPALPAGAQIAFGSTNKVTPPTVTITPNLPSDAAGAIQPGSSTLLPSDYSANYAAQSAPLLQSFLDSLRTSAGVPALAYDPVLGQAAANLIANLIAAGGAFPPQGTAINSQGQTPIQQVVAIAPTSTVTSVSVLSFVADANTAADATDPQTGLTPAVSAFAVDSNQIPINAGWTHYGFAVVTIPTVNTQHNAQRFYVVFFAKE